MTLLRPRTLVAGLAAGLAAVALPAGAAPLPPGAVEVLAGPQASATNYLTPQVVSTAGSVVSFTNLDTTTHDVTSRRTRTVVVKGKKRTRPLFSTPITAAAGTSPVLGSATLKPGSYDFYCSLHPGMKGVLTVR